MLKTLNLHAYLPFSYAVVWLMLNDNKDAKEADITFHS